MALRVFFADFWPGFDPKNNIFLSAMRAYPHYSRIDVVDSISDYDVCICSLFGSQKLLLRNRVLFTGENIRPDYDICESSLGSDCDTYGGRNSHLPLWLLEYDLFGDNPLATFSLSDYLSLVKGGSSPVNLRARANKVCAIFNNRDLGRINMLHSLVKCGLVEGYGRFFGRSFQPGCHAKISLLANYKFHFCTENSYWPGYITEKLFHAQAAGCIAIYDSTNDSLGYLNTQAFIDLRSHDSSDLFKIIYRLISNQDSCDAFASQPLLRYLPYTPHDVSKIVMRSVFAALSNGQ